MYTLVYLSVTLTVLRTLLCPNGHFGFCVFFFFLLSFPSYRKRVRSSALCTRATLCFRRGRAALYIRGQLSRIERSGTFLKTRSRLKDRYRGRCGPSTIQNVDCCSIRTIFNAILCRTWSAGVRRGSLGVVFPPLACMFS